MKGYSPKLPLKYSAKDGPYGMIKDIKTLLMQNLKMLMLTAPGERIMEPDYGVGLRNYLFSNDFSSLKIKLENVIGNQVASYMPMIKIDTIEILNNAGFEEKVDIKISYSVPEFNIQDILSLSINSFT